VVTINLTIVIQVLLFLAFMWAMNRWVFAPVLELLDTRHERVQQDKSEAERAQKDAVQLERKYAVELAAIHREASHKVVEAHRTAQEAHNQRVLELKREADAELLEVHDQAMAQVGEQRQHYGPCVDELVDAAYAAVAPQEVAP
jgi:F-type H+-transporting ATPase subunit b